MKELSIKEIEDEKIIKHLITLFKHEYGENSNARFAGIKVKDIIAWLEKQDEATDINPSEFDLRLNKLLKQFETLPKEELASSLSFYLNVVQNNGTYKEEKQGEQETLCDKCRKAQPSHSCQDITALGRCALEKQGEKKPTEWNDEDYVIQRAALEILMASPKTVASTILKESVIVWLQSLKDRLQPKQDSTERFFEGFKKGEQSVLENYGKYGLCKLTEWRKHK